MHFLNIDSLTAAQILEIFDLTDQLRSRTAQPLLQGKTMILFFPDTSLRTRVSFEKGIRDLGGDYITFPPQTLDKRESPGDMIRYLENWGDAVIVRHPNITKLEELAAHAAIPVINAMTAHNHPCEILADLYALRCSRENYRELTYTFAGPAGNISRTWMEAAKVLNLNFKHVCTAGQELGTENANYNFYTSLEQVLPESDILLTDSLPESFLNEEYITRYQITLERMRQARPGALLNPCPPFFRNEEVSEDAIASPYFAGFGFKKSLIYLQQAILVYSLTH
ncbi:ornithine carbamoyltransferase [Paenibacillus sp. MMS20-IR301]|uniref:ornithine carbamoyltransferase n=1 Tax=Paenibacillus sp. MMS20-IR301 TaxID=2895946 RepID=UPI0028E61A1C|nr:ornithine carbamoyltransferase [Paenibacillus sp. MMS20-IR301]WNS45614.1 ornithine carbamoyltransferase [Paenibacillus sp. MMS20-IR301]